jgi:hypothetical protein
MSFLSSLFLISAPQAEALILLCALLSEIRSSWGPDGTDDQFSLADAYSHTIVCCIVASHPTLCSDGDMDRLDGHYDVADVRGICEVRDQAEPGIVSWRLFWSISACSHLASYGVTFEKTLSVTFFRDLHDFLQLQSAATLAWGQFWDTSAKSEPFCTCRVGSCTGPWKFFLRESHERLQDLEDNVSI